MTRILGFVVLFLSGILALQPVLSQEIPNQILLGFGTLQVVRRPVFDSWRPYKNRNRLIRVGMNKGEVLAIAREPDHKESYYQSNRRQILRISDWYYIRSGFNAETTLLKFQEETLISITSTPTR